MALADQALLATDATFISRVRASMIAACVAVTTEAKSIGLHYRRAPYAVAILNNPDAYKSLFAGAVATNTTIINTATSNDTVPLTTGNLAARAALTLDNDINFTVASMFNSFFVQD